MAYNFYPNNYQNSYPSYPSFQQSNVLWVQGIGGAKAFPVKAGETVWLMDSESQTMFIKAADSTGMPKLRIFTYTEVTEGQQPEVVDMSSYVTKEELEEAIAKIKPKKKKVIEVEDDE